MFIILHAFPMDHIFSKYKNGYCNLAISVHSFHLFSSFQAWLHPPSKPCCLTLPTLNIWNWVQHLKLPYLDMATCLVTATRWIMRIQTRKSVQTIRRIRSHQLSLHYAQRSPIFNYIMMMQHWMISCIPEITCNSQSRQQYQMIKMFTLVYAVTVLAYHLLTKANTTCYCDINQLWNTSMLAILCLPPSDQIGTRLQHAFYPIRHSSTLFYHQFIHMPIG